MSELMAAREGLRQSEERYRQIFDHTTEGIFQTTLDGKIKDVNTPFARMYGYDSVERLREEVEVITELYFDPAQRDEVTRRLLEDGSVTGLDLRFKLRDGSPLWVTLNAHVVRDAGGGVLFLEGTTTDISERKAAEERLRLTQFEVDRALDQVVRVNDEGHIVYANEAAGRAFGYPLEEMLELNIWDITRNFPLEAWQELFEVSRVMETYGLEISALHRDGHSFPVEAGISHIHFAGSEYIVIAGRDVTERRRAER
jgi:PAS domain S-box-containing protein